MNNNKASEQPPDIASPTQQIPLSSRSRKFWFRFLGFTFLTLIACALVGATYVAQLMRVTPGPEEMAKARSTQPSIVLTAQGRQLTVFREYWQEKVGLDKISPWVIKALIATEDHRFYEHRGIDYRRTLYALWRTANGDAQGGSTITQQLARNLFPQDIGRSRTLERKLREMVTAVKIEQAYDKQEILETYLNTVPFLYNVVGIEMAARTYFGKPAARLDVLESATLVGMLKGTSYYNPVLHPQRARKRRNLVLAQMVKRNLLSQQEYIKLRDKRLQVKLNRPQDPPSVAPHFAVYVRQWLTQWAKENGRNLYREGLVVQTTLDDELQQLAAEAVARQTKVLQQIADVEWGYQSEALMSESPATYASLRAKVEPFRYFWKERPELEHAFIRETEEYRKAVAAGKSEAAALAQLKADAAFIKRLRAAKTRLEAGFVAIDPATAEIRAWVGSRDFAMDQFDHVARAARQPGSTFKPFVYAAALEYGLAPDTLYRDVSVEIIAPDGDVWRPTDMSGATGRIMHMREGLVHSKNSITAQVMMDVGLDSIVRLARDSGINRSQLREVPSLALGTSPVTLLEMVSAYTTFAQRGHYREPLFVKRIVDRNGATVASFGDPGYQALSEQTALHLIDMMRGVVQQGTGTALINRFGLYADIAGKSGTTQYNTDGWFILMHPNLVTGAWIGFNDQRVTMRSDYWGQGGHNAILLIGDFYRQALKAGRIDGKARFPRPARRPPGLLQARIAQPEIELAPETDLLQRLLEQEPHRRRWFGDATADEGSGVNSTGGN